MNLFWRIVLSSTTGNRPLLTKKQAELLAYLVAYAKENGGMSPSFREMGLALGHKGKSQVYALVERLERRGFVRRLPNRARGVEVLREGVHKFEADAANPKEAVLHHLGRARDLLGKAQWRGDFKAIIAAQSIEAAIVCMRDAFAESAA